jgi:hypothetical protein
VVVHSLAGKNDKIFTSQVNNAGGTQESREVRKNTAKTSNQQDQMKSYCVYYPLGNNSTCPDCPHLLGTSLTNIEKHLKTHDINMLEYRCGVCDKLWPSWRSVITHYSKSSCRMTSTTSSSTTSHTQGSSNVINRNKNIVEERSVVTSSLATAIDEESEADESTDRKRTTKRRSAGNKKKDKKQEHSPSVEPKECADSDEPDADVRMMSDVDEPNDNDEDKPLDRLSMGISKTDMDSKKTNTGQK